jgi:hypothetical protein
MKSKKLIMASQPTDTSCGPTCLKAIYDYYDYPIELESIIKEVSFLETGGTLEVFLGIHALDRGFNARMFTFNLDVFDPTWFFPNPLDSKALIDKLHKQISSKKNRKVDVACLAYVEFLEKGGKIKMQDLSINTLVRYLKKNIPILTGLSSTYLYKNSREYFREGKQIRDDILGHPEGHFVVLESYDTENKMVTLMDPWGENPYSKELHYSLSRDHLLTAIMLGVFTYDANLMMITRKNSQDDTIW